MRSLLIIILALVACGAPPEPTPTPVSLASVPERHQGQLLALQEALEEGDDATAAHIVRSLEARLEAEADSGVVDLVGAEQVLEGFRRILEGRRLTSLVQMRLDLVPATDAAAVDLVLRAEAATEQEVTLRPGGAILRVEHLFAEPGGEMAYSMRQISLELSTIDVGGQATYEAQLGRFPIALGPGSIAGRTTWSLDLTAGFVERAGVRYPAQNAQVAAADRVELADELPSEPLLPSLLAEAILDPGVGMAGVMERCVRIHPRDYDAALAMLVPLVARATDAEVTQRLAPCLRWLSRGRASGADPQALRRWAAGWARREQGREADDGALDL